MAELPWGQAYAVAEHFAGRLATWALSRREWALWAVLPVYETFCDRCVVWPLSPLLVDLICCVQADRIGEALTGRFDRGAASWPSLLNLTDQLPEAEDCCSRLCGRAVDLRDRQDGWPRSSCRLTTGSAREWPTTCAPTTCRTPRTSACPEVLVLRARTG